LGGLLDRWVGWGKDWGVGLLERVGHQVVEV
jgi:hypothetical protein